MKTYKYKFLNNVALTTHQLNELGAKGWRLIYAEHICFANYSLIFVKEAEEDDDAHN